MKIENSFISPKDIKREKVSKNLDIINAQLKIQEEMDDLRIKIKDKEKVYKDRITGVSGFRDLDKSKDPLEEEILSMESRIRELEKKKAVIPREFEIQKLREEIKAKEKEYKDRITGASGFRDLDKGNDPIEMEILDKEEKIRKLEAEISELGGKKKEAIIKKVAESEINVVDNEKDETLEFDKGNEGDFANEEFGEDNSETSPQERLTEIGTEGGEIILDSENIPNDNSKAINRLTEVGTEGDMIIADSERFIEYEKHGTENINESQENFGSEGENIEHMMEGRGREYRIAKLKEELAFERKTYLEKDYEKNTAFSRVRKFFGNIGKYEEDRKREQDPELAAFRAYYDNKLMELQNVLLEDAKEKGASDEELANLFIEFRKEQKILLAAEHDQVKIEKQEGSLQGPIGKKMTEISKWYQELPLSAKIGMGAVFTAGGFLTAGFGATVGSAFTGAVIARRMFGGMTAGVGTSFGLEARGQMKDRNKIEQDRMDFLEEIKGMDEEKKFEFLSDRIKNIAIKDSDNTINKIKNQDIRQLASGIAVGTLLGSGVFGEFLKWGGGKALEYFGVGAPVEQVAVKDQWSTNAYEASLEDDNNETFNEINDLKPSGIDDAPQVNDNLGKGENAGDIDMTVKDSGMDETPRVDENLGVENKLPQETVADYSRLESELQAQDAIGEMNEKYNEAAGDAMIHPEGNGGPSIDQYEKMGTFDNARKEFSTLLDQMRAEDLPWLGESNIETLIEKGAGSKQLLRVCLENITEGHNPKLAYWSEIKNHSIMEIAYGDGKINNGFTAVVRQFKDIIGDKALPLDEKETTGKWLARVTDLALKEKGNI